jgi:hypothetical protein
MDESYRLLLVEEKGSLTLKSVEKLAMRAPGAHPPDTAAAGRSVVIRDEKDRVLYRRSVNGLIDPTVEYPTGNPEQPLGRVEARRPRLVSIVVPSLPGAYSVALVEVAGQAARGKRAAAKPVDLITVKLGDHDKGTDEERGS